VFLRAEDGSDDERSSWTVYICGTLASLGIIYQH